MREDTVKYTNQGKDSTNSFFGSNLVIDVVENFRISKPYLAF